jgi:hypothetical protein
MDVVLGAKWSKLSVGLAPAPVPHGWCAEFPCRSRELNDALSRRPSITISTANQQPRCEYRPDTLLAERRTHRTRNRLFHHRTRTSNPNPTPISTSNRPPHAQWLYPRTQILIHSLCRVNLRTQKRLASAVAGCGKRKIWLDPNEVTEISNANSRATVRKLISDGLIIKKPVTMHSRARARELTAARRIGRHRGFGKRKGTADARMPR